MNNLEYQEMSVNELVNALYEELELENPCIPEAEKLVLVEVILLWFGCLFISRKSALSTSISISMISHKSS